MNTTHDDTKSNELILVLAANGKTGRRVVERLERRSIAIRRGSRSTEIPFNWNEPSTWESALKGVTASYVVYRPDLAVPAALDAIQQFTDLAVRSGVGRLVLLSGRGEDEALRCERVVQESGIDWTIIRASWFNQNFDEGDFRDLVLSGVIALPVGEVGEPFVDADDIADVAVAALTEPGHSGEVYEVSGPRLLTFAEAVSEIAKASGRDIKYVPITLEEFSASLAAQQVPEDYAWLLNYLFTELFDGRNESVADGVQQALGRDPRDFTDYVQSVAASGAWNQK